ncbi:c-type heme family protein [Novipirellula rosea]|uniref:Tll0287-like domain-containing protein n=1 Tax=Novipirellula rosea TaxID=1031540 RepID=A0ABP8MLU3_9BACT
MKHHALVIGFVGIVVALITTVQSGNLSHANAEERVAKASPNKAAVERSRRTVQMLDNIFKQTIVMVTDKYVNDDDDFAAGSAAVLLFKKISDDSDKTIRLIDATGDPYESENVAKDTFEKEGIKKLKAGAKTVDEVVTRDGKHYLRALTPVPVVMQKCVMCHAHYEDVKTGEPIGAISYTVPID